MSVRKSPPFQQAFLLVWLVGALLCFSVQSTPSPHIRHNTNAQPRALIPLPEIGDYTITSGENDLPTAIYLSAHLEKATSVLYPIILCTEENQLNVSVLERIHSYRVEHRHVHGMNGEDQLCISLSCQHIQSLSNIFEAWDSNLRRTYLSYCDESLSFHSELASRMSPFDDVRMHSIYVGYKAASSLTTVNATELNSLSPYGYYFGLTHSMDIVISGRENEYSNGTRDGVNAFLDLLGFRWYTPTLSVTPTLNASSPVPEIVFRQMGVIEPAFQQRYVGSQMAFGNWNSEFRTFNHIDSPLYAIPPGFVHTSDTLVPSSTYFNDEYAEWYAFRPEYVNSSQSIRGRVPTQLCWSNQTLVEFLVKQVKDMININIQSGRHSQIFSVSQNDNLEYCQCPVCQAINTQEGSPMGSMLRTINVLADAVQQVDADMLVDTLAYQYTRHPPTITKPRKNMIIRLCSIECNFAVPLDDPSNANFTDDLKSWSKIAEQLYIWNYITDFHHFLLPFPNWFVLHKNLQLFHEYGVTGVYEEGDYMSVGGDNEPMKTWLLSKLLWNVTENSTALMDEFITAYYGEAASPYVWEYLESVSESATSTHFYMYIYIDPTASYLTPKLVLNSLSLWNAAYNESRLAGESSSTLERVQEGSISMLYVLLLRWDEISNYSISSGTPWPVSSNKTAVFDVFATLYKEIGITTLNEGDHDLNWMHAQVFGGFAALPRSPSEPPHRRRSQYINQIYEATAYPPH